MQNTISKEKVKVIIDRPLGSSHPNYPDLIYPVNYGYVEGIIAGDNQPQDAYVLGIDYPVDSFEGVLIAIIKRKNDVEDKWVVAKEGCDFSIDEIKNTTYFQEKYFSSIIEKL